MSTQQLVLVLDPGHGGADPGAVYKNLQEADVAFEVVRRAVNKIAAMNLHDFLKVVTTRQLDEFVSLRGRAEIANKVDSDLFISVHFNAGRNGAYADGGHEVFTTVGQTASDRAATIAMRLLAKQGRNRPRTDLADGDPDKEVNFAVLRATHGPAILVEFCFIDSVEGNNLMRDTNYLDECAQILVDTALEFLSLNLPPEVARVLPVKDEEALPDIELASVIDALEAVVKVLKTW